MSTIVDIADAVVVSLNAGTFSQPFTAARRYQPSFTLEDVQDLQVSVVPRVVTLDTAGRRDGFADCTVDIGVQEKIEPGDETRIDALLKLVEEIGDHLRHRRLESFPGAMWVTATHDPVVAADHLDRQRVLTSVLSVTWRVRR